MTPFFRHRRSEIIKLKQAGKTYAQIGTLLGINRQTVYNYVSDLKGCCPKCFGKYKPVKENENPKTNS